MAKTNEGAGKRLTARQSGVFRAYLRRLINKNGWDQAKTGEMIGLTQQSVSAFLRVHSGASAETAKKIAVLAGYEFDVLIDQADVRSAEDLLPEQAVHFWRLVDAMRKVYKTQPTNSAVIQDRLVDMEGIAWKAEESGIDGKMVIRYARAYGGPTPSAAVVASEELLNDEIPIESLLPTSEEIVMGDLQIADADELAFDLAIEVLSSAARDQLSKDTAVRFARSAIVAGVGGQSLLEIIDGAAHWRRAAVDVADRVLKKDAGLRSRRTVGSG